MSREAHKRGRKVTNFLLNSIINTSGIGSVSGSLEDMVHELGKKSGKSEGTSVLEFHLGVIFALCLFGVSCRHFVLRGFV